MIPHSLIVKKDKNSIHKITNCRYFDTKFFKVAQVYAAYKSTAKFQLCLTKVAYIQGSFCVPINFLKLLKSVHGRKAIADYENYKKQKNPNTVRRESEIIL